MQKRGQGGLTSGQISKLVLTAAGFLITLAFLLIVLNLEDYSEKEICALSVQTRATSPDIAERLAPLKCRTQKICLTQGGDCDQFIGEENVQKVNVETAEDIEREIAYNMYDCWDMMGQGKLDVFGEKKAGFLTTLDPQEILEKKTTTCLICSRLALSEDIPSEIIEDIRVNEYMETHQVPGSELTYLQAFTDKQIRSYPREFREEFDDPVNPTDEVAITFMQIITENTPGEAATQASLEGAGFVFGATGVLGPIGRILSWKLQVGAIAAGGIATGTISGIQTYRSRQVSAGVCGEFAGQAGNEGCSIVTPFDYNQIENINKFCANIEGQP